MKSNSVHNIAATAILAAVLTVAAPTGGAWAAEMAGNAASKVRITRESALYGLPSSAGGHLARIKSLEDNSWVNLGAPKGDSEYGLALGRAYSPKMAYAHDLRGAFLYGEGVHAFKKKDGRCQDDLWFYDLNAHAWICCYPGTNMNDAKLKLNKDGFWENAKGEIFPVTVCHGWHQVAYDPDSHKFAAMKAGSSFSLGKIKGLDFRDKSKYWAVSGPPASPWFWDVATGHWERQALKGPKPSYGEHLVWIPSLKKFWYRKSTEVVYLYDPSRKQWEELKPKGPKPPFGISAHALYDSKRERVYLCGGIYPVPKNTESLWIYDVKKKEWTNAKAKNSSFKEYPARGRHIVHYDSVNDALLLFHFDTSSIHVYDPTTNAWNQAAISIPGNLPTEKNCFNGFYDPKINAHFIFAARDSRNDGNMLVYRYKRVKP